MSMYIKLLVFALLATQDIYANCTGGNSCCTGQCGQGEGDCDKHSDCLFGLICEFDGWWGDDWCKAGPDTTNAYWGSWSDWPACVGSCGGTGSKTRTRSCVEATNGGYPCSDTARLSGSSTDTESCTTDPCPVNGDWGVWTNWTSCSVTCGDGSHSRTRLCDNPAPDHGGLACAGDSSETEACNDRPCPIDGGWGDWDDWTPCSANCGAGTQYKSRKCDNPAPDHGGLNCAGGNGTVETACQACDGGLCSYVCPAVVG